MAKVLKVLQIICIANLSNIHTSTVDIHNLRFHRKTYCNVAVPPLEEITSTLSRLKCAVQCYNKDVCFGFSFNTTGVCKLYSQDGWGETQCSAKDFGARSVFVKENQCKNGGHRGGDNICICVSGYTGPSCERFIEDCTEGYEAGYHEEGIYWIKPKSAPAAFQVTCQMNSGQGFTVIQSRFDSKISFNKTWQEYKEGFNQNMRTDFWLGNQKIHWITTSHPQTLFVQLSNSTNNFMRYHYDFVMTSETRDFAVTYNSSWSPPDPSRYMEECWPGTSIRFSTYDRDNMKVARNCASLYGAGFWFQSKICSLCNPNGNMHPSQKTRLNIPSENFWTPTLGNWTPDYVRMVLVRKPK